jgi:putative flavoprotein involved in K+ transport
VNTVVWCTGSGPDFGFLDVAVFGEDGMPRHSRGISVVPGLFFMGTHFQFALASEQIQGVDRDARYVLKHLVAPARHEARQLVSSR